jgi:hypothetical protein
MEFQERCPNCGAERIEGSVYCGNCGKPFEEKKPEPEDGPRDEQPQRPEEPIKPVFPAEPPPSDDERKYTAWEDRENKGFFEALWETWKESVFYPEKFFARLPFRGGIGNPLLYAVIVGCFGIIISQIYGIFWSNAWTGFMSHYMDFEEMMFETGLQTGLSFLQIIISPIIIMVGVFIMSGIYHLIFLVFGWGKRDFEATFRAVAYSEGAMVFLAVPFCGGIIAFVWSIVLTIIGMKHLQKTTGGKAALVYFLPWIICCCLISGFFLLMMLIFGAAFFEAFGDGLNDAMYEWSAHYFITR